MKFVRVVLSAMAVMLLSVVVMAQAPQGEIDAHRRGRQGGGGSRFPKHVRQSLSARRRSRSRARGCGPGVAAAAAGEAARGRGAGGTPQTPDRTTWYAPPFKVFDNFYWLGTRQHSSWALQTSAGIILIDTNFAWATEPEIIQGLTTLGLNPRDLKYVVISHAHGDHDQGAAELQKRFGAKVVMGAPDWESTLQRPATRGRRCADT